MFTNAHATFTTGEERRPNGVMWRSPVIPFTRCGMAFAVRPPATRSSSSCTRALIARFVPARKRAFGRPVLKGPTWTTSIASRATR